MWDCIVIGAGPAGASAARRAAQLGLKTLLLEKESFPRPKPCGGALSIRTLSLLDFPLPESVVESVIYGIRAHFKGRVVEAQCPDPLALTVRRETFDQVLAEKARSAGAHCFFGEKVHRYLEHEDFVLVESGTRVHQGRYLIAANGAKGFLRTGKKRKQPRNRYWVTMTGRLPVRNGTDIPEDDGILQFHFDACPGGYGWVFPLKNEASVGIGGWASWTPKPAGYFQEFMKRLAPQAVPAARGSVIPCPGIGKDLGSPRILKAGDAGGFAEAFSGEGISYAVQSGQLAALTVAEKIRGLAPQPLFERYRRRCLRSMGDNLIYARQFAFWAYRFPKILFEAFGRNREWVEAFLRIPRGESTYKDLFLRIWRLR